jgi:oxygen-independent coproporphyrinogen III oxidase
LNDADSSSVTENETHVGNYFVANYPPFSCWSHAQLAEASDVLDQPPADVPLGLYLHIPYCRKRCHFCYFRVYTDKNSEHIKRYLDALEDELTLYRDRAILGGRKPSFVYFGGGTPSYLSVRQLEDLCARLRAILPWDEAREITFECEPGTLTEAKVKAIRALGVTRLSLGVEHFDDAVLKVNNRAHLSGEVYRAYEWARAAGFPQINVDLIAGMVNDTDERWTHTVGEALALAPDSVTIYQMEVPYNTTIYSEMKANGSLTAPVASWPTKRRWVSEAFARFEQAGYQVGSAYTATRSGSEPTRFLYRDALWHGADLLGLGVASFSHLSGVHFQNKHENETYEAALATGQLPLHRALRLSSDERLIREFILQMKLGRLDFAPFKARFGIDPATRFAGPLETLVDEGHAVIEAGRLTLTRDALLQVDELLHRFFLPEHRELRYS